MVIAETDINKWTDNALAEEYLKTQEIAYFDEIYRRYSNKIYYKCYSILGDFGHAEDATQDIFLKLILSLAKFNQKSKFSTWLYSITYNYCIDELRRQKKNKMIYVEDGQYNDIEEDEDDALIQEENYAALQATLDVIDEADRAILIMKYQDNLMVKDIAEILSLSESAVKMRLKRAKVKFQKIFKDILRQ